VADSTPQICVEPVIPGVKHLLKQKAARGRLSVFIPSLGNLHQMI